MKEVMFLVAMVMSGGSADPVKGAIFGIGFIVVVILLSLAAVKSGSNGGAKKIKQKYEGKILEEGKFNKSMHYFLTEDEFLVQKYNAVFAIYKLSAIRYVGIRYDSVTRSHVLYMTDADKNVVKPDKVVGGTKAAQKLYGKNLPSMSLKEAEPLRELIMKHAPHVHKEEEQQA